MPDRQYTPEMAVDLQMAGDVQVSPDGSQVAFCVAPAGHRETNRNSTIYVVPSDGSAPPRPLTGGEHNNTGPRWSPDGRTIAFLSDRPSRGSSQLHRISTDGGEPLRLTNLQGGVASVGWTPDGRFITFTARRTALAGERDSESEITVASEVPRTRAVARVPVSGGSAEIIGPGEGHVWAYAASPDGATYTALTSTTDLLADSDNNTDLVLFQADGSSRERVLVNFGRWGDRVVWSPDSRYVMTINSRPPDFHYQRVHVVEVSSGSVTTFDDREMTPNWAGFDANSILVLNVAGQRTRLDRADVAGNDWSGVTLDDKLQNRWISPQMSLSTDGEVLGLLAASPTRPPDVFAITPYGESRQLTDLNPQLDTVALADMREITWQREDGLTIYGWLLLPPQRDSDVGLPLVVNVHGGPSMAWGNWFHGTWHDWAQNLAARGFAVLLPNPRGSTGQGHRFTGANQSDLGGQDFQDVMAGIDTLVENGTADPDRIGIGGWSYGGFLTTWAVTQSDRFKAAVAGAAVTNWPSKVGTTDIRPVNEFNFPGPLHEQPDNLWERSPVRYLKNVTTPTLIVHGEADPRVPVSQGREFYLGLKAVGVETDFVTYPRQQHAFHERAFQLDLLSRMCDWFERYVLS